MAQITLAQNLKTSYGITLASDAIPAEKTAAEQLKKYLEQVTGATYEIRNELEGPAPDSQIYIGAGPRVKALLPKQDWAALGNDGIVIKTVGKDLILAGGRPRGSLYAVFQFLEDEVGCKWWTPKENSIPQQRTLTVRPQTLTYVSPFSYREQYANSVREDSEFATIMRENGHHQTQSEAWGGHYDILGFVHTFSMLLPLEKYFKDHPEWYSDPANGSLPCTPTSKMPEEQQTDPDYSNPEVVNEVAKNALEWIMKSPKSGYISISQNDNSAGYCRCPKCAAIIAEEGSPAGPLIKFVNEVAAKIHEQYPNFLVETLAYNYSEQPPKNIKPAPNVIVRLAPINADFGHPYDSDWNQETRDRLVKWRDVSSQLFIWNYVTNFHGIMFPHPNWDGLAKDLRYFAANKVTGVFQQGDSYTNGVGDFVQLRDWLNGKLMWNPNLDQSKLTNEFLNGYYGAAGPFLRQYLDLTEKSFKAQNIKLPTKNSNLSFFTLDVMNQSVRLFDKAKEAVKHDDVLSSRVRRTRLSMELARLYRFNTLQRVAVASNVKLLGEADPNKALEEFIKTAQEYGAGMFSEGETFAAKIPSLRAMFTPPVELPEFAKQYPAHEVVDVQPEGYTFYQKGTLTELEKDPAASNGSAASMVGDTNEWAIQASLGRALDGFAEGKWHIYALARVVAKGAPLPAIPFQSGI